MLLMSDRRREFTNRCKDGADELALPAKWTCNQNCLGKKTLPWTRENQDKCRPGRDSWPCSQAL